MSRSRLTYFTTLTLSALTVLFVSAGCSHHAPAAISRAPAAAPQPTTSPATFQPYTLLPVPPPTPPARTHRHRVLHLTRYHNRVYLTDSDRHLYEAGRDAQGHIYPIYRDPVTHAAYPLLYDPARDNLYRVARSDDGRFYRNYVGQPGDQFYASDRDYERVMPSDDDRPIVTDSYNTYNYNTYNYGPVSYGDPLHRRPPPSFTGYKPPPPHAGHHADDWLWGIPVVIGLYLLLPPHHHAPPPRPRPAPTTIIVRQTTPITIINQAPPAPRPVYSLPPAPQVRQSAPPPHPAAFAPHLRPNLRPQPVSPAQPTVQAHMPAPAPRPAFRRVHAASHPLRPAALRRSEPLAARPISIHRAAPPPERPPAKRTVTLEPSPARRDTPRPASHEAPHPAAHVILPEAPRKDRPHPDHAAKPKAKPSAPKKAPPVKAKKDNAKSEKP